MVKKIKAPKKVAKVPKTKAIKKGTSFNVLQGDIHIASLEYLYELKGLFL